MAVVKPTTTRRAALAGTISAALLGAPPAKGSAGAEAALLAACREMHAAADLRDALDAGTPDPAMDLWSLDRWNAGIDALIDLPAHTPAGLRAKARAVARVLRIEYRVQMDLTPEEQSDPHEILALWFIEEVAKLGAE